MCFARSTHDVGPARFERMISPRTVDRLPMPFDQEVHVWEVSLSQVGARTATFAALLTADEKQRAASFFREEDRSRFIVAHGLLRQLLGQYLSVKPEELRFRVNAFGKPALIQTSEEQPLSFNLAHSGDVILYAVTRCRKVGIDVEQIQPDLDVMELAQSQFAEQEVRCLQAFGPNERRDVFFRIWTCKEAYIKARGQGLSLPLQGFAVTLGRNEPTQIGWSEDDPDVSKNWSVFHLDTLPGYAAAVVVEGRPVQLVSRRW